jgi:dTMP kinase
VVPGKFIVFAGADGCGKDTVVERVFRSWSDAGVPCVTTSEPTRDTYGEDIMARLAGRGSLDPVELTLLFALDRARHLRMVEERLAAGQHVLASRYVESSLVYQGPAVDADPRFAGADGARWVREVNRLFRLPDLYVVIDVPDEILAARVAARGRPDRFESDLALQRRVAASYRALHGAFWPEVPVSYLPGALPPERVCELALVALRATLGIGAGA